MSDNKKKCRGCTNSVDGAGVYCPDCRSRKCFLQSERQRRFVGNGLCPCGKEPRNGYSSCPRCLTAKRRYMRRRYKRLRATGCCARCAGPANGKATCPECVTRHGKYNRLTRKLRCVAVLGRVCSSCWRSDEITAFTGSYLRCCSSCETRGQRNGSCPTCGYAMYWPMRRLPQCPWCYPEYRLQGNTLVVDRLAGALSSLLRSIGRQIEADAERKLSEWTHAGWRTVRKAIFRLRHLNELHGWIGRREYAAATPGNDKAASRHWWRLLKHLENYNIPHEVRTREARKEVMVLMPKYDIMGPPPRPKG